MNPAMTNRIAAGVTATYLLEISRGAARTTEADARHATGRSRARGAGDADGPGLRRPSTPAHGSRRRGERVESASRSAMATATSAACRASASPTGFAR